jgi:hypothetical protein
VLAVLWGTAAADDDEPRVRPLRKASVGVAFSGGGGAINGVSTGGLGPIVEVGVGVNRTLIFLEGGYNWSTLGTEGEIDTGHQLRGALGARWIARSLDIERAAAIELVLEGLAGAHKYWWKQTGELVRPEFTIGWGLQVRKYRSPHVMFRFGFRMFWAPTDDDRVTTVARGAARSDLPATNGGFIVVVGGAL